MSRRRKLVAALLVLAVACVAMLATYHAQIRAWWKLRREFEAVGRNAQGFLEYRHRKSDIVFVRIPGGSARVGWTDSALKDFARTSAEFMEDEDLLIEDLEGDLGPQLRRREVHLAPFLIAKYELTLEQWEQVIGSFPYERTAPNEPVEYLDWHVVDQFCEVSGLSMPTEEQWEYACLGGTIWTPRTAKELAEIAWFDREIDPLDQPAVVGLKRQNGYGLHDMLGNVSEWCLSVWPEGDTTIRVLKGGSYDQPTEFLDPRSRQLDTRDTLWERSGVGLRPAYEFVPP